MENRYLVYYHKTPSNKYYIGITHHINPNRRWQNGFGYKRQVKFYNAIIKYGWSNIEHCVIKSDLDLQTACELEKYYIEKFDSIKNGYNVDVGGTVTNVGVVWSEEIRRKMGAPKIGKTASSETRKKMSASRKNKPIYKIRKPVIQLTLDGTVIAVFDSIKSAGETLGIRPGHISEVCRGNKSRKKSVKFFDFEYYTGGNNVQDSKQ